MLAPEKREELAKACTCKNSFSPKLSAKAPCSKAFRRTSGNNAADCSSCRSKCHTDCQRCQRQRPSNSCSSVCSLGSLADTCLPGDRQRRPLLRSASLAWSNKPIAFASTRTAHQEPQKRNKRFHRLAVVSCTNPPELRSMHAHDILLICWTLSGPYMTHSRKCGVRALESVAQAGGKCPEKFKESPTTRLNAPEIMCRFLLQSLPPAPVLQPSGGEDPPAAAPSTSHTLAQTLLRIRPVHPSTQQSAKAVAHDAGLSLTPQCAFASPNTWPS